MKKHSSNTEDSTPWSELESRLERDAKLHQQKLPSGLHEQIMSEVQGGGKTRAARTYYLPYLAAAACLCVALLLMFEQEPAEPESPLFWITSIPELLAEEADPLASYESEWDNLQADIDAGVVFLLSAIKMGE